MSGYHLFKSFTLQSTWQDIMFDFGIVVASLLAGMAIYFMIHGSPLKAVEVEMDKLGQNPAYCYTQEEAEARYGKDEGRECGDDVMVCGCRLPKKRAVKFMKLCGPKVADAFMKLSFEERHGVMAGTVKFPDQFMTESLSEFYIGSDGAYCNSCKAEPSKDNESFEVCQRCKYTACPECLEHKKTGTCYCRDENFGIPYPPPNRRKFYQKGVW